jgi:UDP-GlcNAc:undecaprenyl-phosphate/decaprenyl-phosphate GlcNAc-1-phosphate transferase
MINFLRKALVPISPVAILILLLPFASRLSHKGGIYLHLHLFATAFFIAVLVTPLVRLAAIRFGALDKPDPRKIHKTPTALFGGIAVFIAFFASHFVHFEFNKEMIGIFVGGLLLLIVGAVDDKTGGIPARFRLFSQIVASGIAIYFGVVLDFYPYMLWGKIISIIVSVIWIVGITNAFNFLDGMDGLATGLTSVTSGIFFIISYRLNNPYLGFISISLCGASLGFLLHNFKPAKIFLGDAGSTFLGFTLACFGLMGDWSNGDPFVSFSVPVMVLGIPIFDMIFTTIERFASGKVHNLREWLAYTGKDHFHHRLSDHGFKDAEVVFFIYFINLTLGLSAVVIAVCSTENMVILLAQSLCVFLIITILMGYTSTKRNGVKKTDNVKENADE